MTHLCVSWLSHNFLADTTFFQKLLTTFLTGIRGVRRKLAEMKVLAQPGIEHAASRSRVRFATYRPTWPGCRDQCCYVDKILSLKWYEKNVCKMRLVASGFIFFFNGFSVSLSKSFNVFLWVVTTWKFLSF